MRSKVIEDPNMRDRTWVFENRKHAGEILAQKLSEHKFGSNAVVLAIPSGGVPVAYEIARVLGCIFDVIIVRKVQFPWNPEAGFGAVAETGHVLFNEDLISHMKLDKETIEDSLSHSKENIKHRVQVFRRGKPLTPIRRCTVIVVDDGLASGFTMLAALRAVKHLGASRVIVATPTGSLSAVQALTNEADQIFCLNIRTGWSFAVADAYKKWYDLADSEVQHILSGKFSG